MTQVILLVLAAVWAAFLLPPWLQNRNSSVPTLTRIRRGSSPYEGSTLDISRAASIGRSADRPIGPLDPEAGSSEHVGARIEHFAPESTSWDMFDTASLMPRSATAATRRRREVLTALGGLSLVSLLLFPLIGSMAALLLVVSFGMLAGYTFLLFQRAQRQAERRQKVRPLRTVEVERLAPLRTVPAQPLRRSVGS